MSTAYLQSILGTTPDLGLRLQGTQYSVNTSLGSIELAPGTSPPTLTVTYTAASVPVPPSLLLFASGLSAVVYGSRRRAARPESS